MIRSGRTGFTLIEMLIALATLGILLAIAINRMDVTRYAVNASARSLVSDLSTVQREAVTRQHDMRVAFDLAGQELRVHYDVNNDGVMNGGERIRELLLGDGMMFGRSSAPALPFGAGDVSFTLTQGGWPVVVFRRDGSASQSGGFYVTSARGTALSISRHARAIEVVRATGRPMLLAYNGSAWLRGD